MNLSRQYVWGSAFLLAAGIGTANAEPAGQRCEPIKYGVEYRTFLPDGQRYVYVSVKALSGYQPSVFVMIDKNYVTTGAKPVKNDALMAWWLDRSKPMTFSTDKVKARWRVEGVWHSVTSLISDPDWAEVNQPIRGLEPDGSRFLGTPSTDTNTYAFQTRLEMPGMDSDAFDVALPAVGYEGITVTPPVVHFERDDDTIKVKC